MASITQAGDRAPRRSTGPLRKSHIVDTTRHDYTSCRDKLDRMRDQFINEYRKQTMTLTSQENRILAKQLADSFQFMADMGN